MANRAVFHSVNDLFQRLHDNHELFGGKIVVLLRDFRQTCPVVPHGSRTQVVDASIKSSPLWPAFHVYHLTIPVRNAEDPDYARFVDAIGNGAGPDVAIDLIPHVVDSDALIAFTFPSDVINNADTCLQRSILAPTNAQIDAYNTTVIESVHGQQQTYFAADTLKEADDAGVPIDHSILDYAARHTPPGLPAHALTIKVNGVYRLIRNLSIDRGLVKNARVVIKHIGRRLITVRVLRGMRDVNAFDEDILIPRISFSATLASGHTLLRLQFPLAPAYATTFNSCQGLTLDRIAVDLIRPVFSHGQLYTALSRIRHRSHARESIAAVGTVCLALEAGLTFFLFFILQKYPDYVRLSMWGGLIVRYLSLFASSFATRVWQLILLQVGVGIGGGVMYMPIIYLLPQWFSERRGLAGGIIFWGWRRRQVLPLSSSYRLNIQ
ncbi:hypothetical protein GSI_03014 [Ganoderma sinense ZZ0214-1]|uniref:ATP-dependent DNA helicase n=1 Tax=Ganoderma sinense ZZ0214-1 TaxID=1077348 RepID=A0A2G8SN81_9APHY|nr:hypothetical protein GSI_03014 [Ganoderma sinense ZZ0214-1]